MMNMTFVSDEILTTFNIKSHVVQCIVLFTDIRGLKHTVSARLYVSLY